MESQQILTIQEIIKTLDKNACRMLSYKIEARIKEIDELEREQILTELPSNEAYANTHFELMMKTFPLEHREDAISKLVAFEEWFKISVDGLANYLCLCPQKDKPDDCNKWLRNYHDRNYFYYDGHKWIHHVESCYSEGMLKNSYKSFSDILECVIIICRETSHEFTYNLVLVNHDNRSIEMLSNNHRNAK